MTTPNIDLLLSDITFRRGWLAKMLEVTVHDGDDTRFDAVSIVDLIDEVRALRKERDEARKDAARLADVICAALDAPIDLGELAGHSEGDAFRDGYELARTRIDAALTQEDA
jgi:hypothetical protein